MNNIEYCHKRGLILPYIKEEELIDLLRAFKLLTISVKNALIQAKNSHSKQKRKDSKRGYLEEHIYPIAYDLVLNFSENRLIDEIIVTALLHDVIEDDVNVDKNYLEAKFGEKILQRIKYLTKPESQDKSENGKFENNKQYLEIISRSDEIVRIVKLADRSNNLLCDFANISFIHNKERFNRYLIEVRELYLPIAKESSIYYFNFLTQLLEVSLKM